MNGLQQRLEAVLVRKELGGIIDALREIELDLQDVKLGAEGKIYADISGIGRLVPINIMGDGIIKILATLVAILEMKDGILLIDDDRERPTLHRTDAAMEGYLRNGQGKQRAVIYCNPFRRVHRLHGKGILDVP